jgi:carboxymethylenebutenolidase
MGAMIDFVRPDGQPRRGYLAEASNPQAPAMVVLQEWWGLNNQIRGVADRLARAGYHALVPDLYGGKATVEAEEAHHLMEGLNFADAASQDIRGAVQVLKARGAPAVGVTGFCMGGALTVLSLCLVPEVDAGVIWYGMPPLEYVDAKQIKVPVLAHWALQDAFFPIAGVDALEEKLRVAAVTYQGHRYQANHAFANETAQGTSQLLPETIYDERATQTAWDRTFRFLGSALRS